MAHNRMKQQVDYHRSERSFEVGDWVFLRLQPYRHMSLNHAKKDNKLSPNILVTHFCCSSEDSLCSKKYLRLS